MRKILIYLWKQRLSKSRDISLIFGLICLLQFAYAFSTQNMGMQDEKRTITGVVTDAITGEALPGVSIIIKGTTTGTTTDTEGKYTLEVSTGDIIVFSFISYLTEEITASTQTVINIQMVQDIVDLNEVVVIGYGAQKKKLSTGATVHVGGDNLAKRNSMRIEQALQGVTPGVQITSNTGQPGEKPKVRIRGIGTVGNSDPLYIVDGVPTEDIRYLNPLDVESVDVLKDAASAAIYGARAANGVVLITTKHGKNEKMKVSYDGYYGIQNVAKKIDLLNGAEYMQIRNEAAENSGAATMPYSQEEIDSIGDGTDWQDEMFAKNAPTHSNSLLFAGGNEYSVYSSSISRFYQEGIVGEPGKSAYERISARLNSEHKMYKEIFKVGENMVYSHSKIRGIGVGNIWGGNNIVRSFLNASPVFPVYDENEEDGFARSTTNVNEANPYAVMHYSDNRWEKNDQLLGNIYGELTILKDFKFRTDLGIDMLYKYFNTYYPEYQVTSQIFNDYSRAYMRMERNFTYNFENYLTYNKTFNDHNLILLAGMTASKYRQFWMSGTRESLLVEDMDFAVLNMGVDSTSENEGSKLETALNSYFGRVNYNYREKYMLAATLRYDGSSRFGSNNKAALFPSVSAGWILTQEEFFNVTGIDYLKLRGSWGKNGNEKIGNFQYDAFIQSRYRDYYFGNDVQYVGSSPVQIPNDRIKWEASEQLDIGFDSRFLSNFSLAFDAYKKTTKDWLVIAPIPALVGNDPPAINGGTVVNQGVEFDLGYQKMSGDFIFTINANLTYNKNKVTYVDHAGNTDPAIEGEPDVLYNQCYDVYRVQEGYPIGYFYGFEMMGIFQNEQEIEDYYFINEDGDTNRIQNSAHPGDIKFADLNHDGTINRDDRTMIGDPNPDFVFGFSFNGQYKGFDISIFMQGVAGNQILYSPRNWTSSYSNYPESVVEGRWQGENTSNTVPRVTTGNSTNFQYVSEYFIQNGSYLKIRNLTLGYDFKQTLLKKLPVGKFRIYASAQNLYTFTKYTGYDPEVGYGDYNIERYQNYSTGVDIGYYPTPRTYLIGLNIEF